MWGRKKQSKQADSGVSLQPEQSYWATHPDPVAQPQSPSPQQPPAESASGRPQPFTVTVNGQPIDFGADGQHHVITLLAQMGKLTETHVFETTRHATPDQQHQVAQLLEQRRSGAITDQVFAAAVVRVMQV
jgi:hypothetical protein